MPFPHQIDISRNPARAAGLPLAPPPLSSANPPQCALRTLDAGNWQPKNGLGMTWSEGDVWHVRTDSLGLREGEECKLIVANEKNPAVTWENGPNRKLSGEKTVAFVFGNTGARDDKLAAKIESEHPSDRPVEGDVPAYRKRGGSDWLSSPSSRGGGSDWLSSPPSRGGGSDWLSSPSSGGSGRGFFDSVPTGESLRSGGGDGGSGSARRRETTPSSGRGFFD